MTEARRTTLVTGATGFTGGALCRALVADGEPVRALVRSAARAVELAALGVDCREVDIADPAAVGSAMDGVSRVFHLAAAWRTEHADRDEFRRINVEATRCLIEAARRAGVGRFVHCSTVGVQGQIDDPPADESYRTAPGDHYQATKLEGELIAREAFAADLPGCVVRPVGIYGPGDTRFLKLFRPVARGRFVMIGSGRTLYHMTYIDDLVAGLRLAGERPGALGEVFTIAGPRVTTLGELVDEIATAVGRRPPRLRVPYAPVHALSRLVDAVCRPLGIEPPIYPRRVEFFGKDRAFTIDKARRLLGYRPAVDLPEGVRRTVEWYRGRQLI